MIFFTNALFETVGYDKVTDDWIFSFADKIYVSATGFWRLLISEKIAFISLDHGHQFGLPEPLDLIEEVTKALSGQRLEKIEIARNTSDLVLTVSGGIKLEIYTASTGYESFEFSISGNRYVAVAGRVIVI